MPKRIGSKGLFEIFLGSSPSWYKLTVIVFLVANPLLFKLFDPMLAGWALIVEFIFTLAMALKCYPLAPGGLLALEAVVIGMTSPAGVYEEVVHNFPVILLLMFMVAGIYFMKDFLRYAFSKILIRVESKLFLSLLFCFLSAVLSAFLDALTVIAVIMAVAYGFYESYHRVLSAGVCSASESPDPGCEEERQKNLKAFRGFLRDLMMHSAIGTALGGVTTLVGEPQNLLIGTEMGWSFISFFLHMAPVSLPVMTAGLLTCALLEKFSLFGYGTKLPPEIRQVLAGMELKKDELRTGQERTCLIVQALGAVFLVIALAFHLAEVGLIGLGVIILLTAFCGITDEQRIGRAFEEALPFTGLLVVFFAVVAVINDQKLFKPVIDYVLGLEGGKRLSAYYAANGILSAVSDNVFVATVYMKETMAAFKAGIIDRTQLEHLAVAINMGTNIPSIATPNGQAAFLFLLTSSLAPLIRLSYGRMVRAALPYAIVLTLVGYVFLMLSIR